MAGGGREGAVDEAPDGCPQLRASALQEPERRGRSPLRRRVAATSGTGRGGGLEAVGEEERQSLSPRWMSLSGGMGGTAQEEAVRTALGPPRLECEEEAYYSEPERDVHWSASSPDTAAGQPSLSHRASCSFVDGRSPLTQQQVPLPPLRGRAATVLRSSVEERTSSSSSLSVQLKSRAASDPSFKPCEDATPARPSEEAERAAAAAAPGMPSSSPPATSTSRCCCCCCRAARGTCGRCSWWKCGARSGARPRPRLDFPTWLLDEVQSRPDESQLPRVPRSHLVEVAQVPGLLEKLLLMGFLLCFDILLHELSFTPLQVVRALPKMPARALGALCGRTAAKDPWSFTVTEQGDLIRLTLLVLNVALILVCFDVSWTYHYIRGESFLKLYVIFNMLEMFERWCRSVGVDMFDMVIASVRHPWGSFLVKYAATLVYCFVHSTMHLVRVLLLNVAINTSSNAVFLIIVTNNFGEIKSTVFKRYEAKSLFPIITSDIVERFYLLMDIIFVLARHSISTHSGTHSRKDVTFWLFLLVGLELSTDWIKFCLIMKFSDLTASTLEVYKEVLIADVLLCRSPRLGAIGAGHASEASGAPAPPKDKASQAPNVPFRGIHSFSHSLQRRLGFSGVPMTTILVLHLVMLARAPCSVELQWPRATILLFAAASFVLCLLAKILLGAIILGFAARRRSRIPRGLELFPKIKSL
uniref:Uncharacterized protein n=1 Tax=Alexandrium monilatum TaxID=311494 RepID=A0A6T0X384_9DINO